eukprot:XP_014787931.1 PREDICTED: uncharacterized protein LOC106881921 isoform X2 [Octopus bimaculoides]
MAVVYEQRSPENGATNCINQSLDNIHSEAKALHFIYDRHLFDSYAIALVNNDELYEKWKITDPKFWSSDDVLDWLYYIGEENDVDFGNFSAESFQCLKVDELGYQVTEANTRASDTNVYTIIREIMASENNFQSDDQTCFNANLNQKEHFNDSTEHNHLPCSSLHDEPTNVQFPLDVSLNQIQYDYLQPKTEYQIDEETDCFQNLSYTTLTNKMDCESKPDLSSLNTTKLKEEDDLHTSRSPKSLKQMGKNVTRPSRKPTKCKAASTSSKSHLKAHNTKTKKTRAGWYTINGFFIHNHEG